MSSDIYQKISKHLNEFINQNTRSDFSDPFFYSVIPPGKLFRPLLCYHIAQDLNYQFDHKLLALMTAIELHHAYSLVHDDLPSMDNDDFRRGKPSCHKQFGEWQAILTGDGLLNLSYQALSSINSNNLSDVLKLFSKKLGPKGLILGQFLDLSHQIQTIEDVIEVHILKTGRLLEVCTLGTLWLSNKKRNKNLNCDFLRLGQYLGVIFQILDDLDELNVDKISIHEGTINAFIIDDKKAFKILEEKLFQIDRLFSLYLLNETKNFFNKYFKKNVENIKKGQSQIALHISDKNLITNFLSTTNSFEV